MLKACRREYQRAWEQKHKERRSTIAFLKKYGITPQQKQEIFLSQGKACAACKDPCPGPGSWHMDHNHKTGKIRGVLCSRCNLALGHAKECPKRLRNLAKYISKHQPS